MQAHQGGGPGQSDRCLQDNIGDLDFSSFSQEDRELVMAARTALTNTLTESFDRVTQ